MRDTILTTLLYKYNPYARFIFFLYIISIFLLCLFVCDKIPMYIVWLLLCIAFMPLVYGAISKKSIFNFRSWDNRLLTFSPSFIRIGNQKYDISEIAIELHINAYDGFINRIRRKGLLKPYTMYGDNNMLIFVHNGISYDVEFHLRDYNSYLTLCKLTDDWKAAGVRVKIKEAFTREFVQKQYERQSRRA
jgi:hypothetical protein